jgi:outer membrane immunogenic protein
MFRSQGELEMYRLQVPLLAAVAVIGLASRAHAAPPPAPYSWTGFYIGGNAGYGWGNSSFAFSPGDDTGAFLLYGSGTEGIDVHSGTFRESGPLGGMQLGYNWQFGRNWVTGIEADIDLADVSGSTAIPGIMTFPSSPLVEGVVVTASQKLEWFGTVRARLGYLPTDRLLVFATGGLAYGETKTNSSIAVSSPGFGAGALSCVGGSACVAGAESQTSAGWTVGGGVEYAAWKNLTIRAEYLYVNLGNQNVNLTTVPPSSGPGSVVANFNQAAFNIVRVGINYKFH